MKKKVPKPKLLGTPQQQFEVILEDIRSEVHMVHEQTSDLLSLKPIVQKLSEDMEIVKTDVEIMKGLLKRKVDLEEFEALTKRVAHLESKARMHA